LVLGYGESLVDPLLKIGAVQEIILREIIDEVEKSGSTTRRERRYLVDCSVRGISHKF